MPQRFQASGRKEIREKINMLFSKIIQKKFDAVLGRYDGDPAIRYASVSDFPGIERQSFDVNGDKHVKLKGWFYFYGSLRPENLIVFDHGIGAGHLNYLPEIEFLAKNGYTVYSYDHTGCVSTGGSGILGFAQGVNDLDCVLTAIQQNPQFSNVPRKLIGHSWGGYAVMNVSALHPEVTHVVSLAGFLSARSLIEQYIPKVFLKYSEEVMERERRNNPKYADMDARESLLKSQANLLHLQSKDDTKVKFELSYIPLSEALKDRKNTELIALDRRNHDPQRTPEAASANMAMLQELDRKRKKKQLSSLSQQKAFQEAFDWNLISQQDTESWNTILTFLQK